MRVGCFYHEAKVYERWIGLVYVRRYLSGSEIVWVGRMHTIVVLAWYTMK